MRTLRVNNWGLESTPQHDTNHRLRRPSFPRYLHPMLTGELAKQAGVNLESIRFYEREGLLPCPPRAQSGYRCYDQRHLETIRFIKRSQALGFTLGEIRQLLQLHERLASGKPPKKQSQDLELVRLTRERLHSIEHKIESLESMRRQLAKFLRTYQSHKQLGCPAGK